MREAREVIAEAFASSLATDEVLEGWNTAKVAPLFKETKDIRGLCTSHDY